MTQRVHQVLLPIYLGLCLVLGGASAAGLGVNVLLQLLAIPVLVAAALTRKPVPMGWAGRQLLILAGVVVLAGAIQLVPLPPEMWTALPGRAPLGESYRLIGQPLPWLPLSLAPYATIASLLWLLPALAILLAAMKRGIADPAHFAWVVIGVMALSVIVGALQISGGAGSPWYFYRITNYGVTVGFFANANHMATLLLVSLPFLAALYASRKRTGSGGNFAGAQSVMTLCGVVLVAIGLVINGSLAGLGLMLPVVIASLLILSAPRKPPRWAVPALVLFTGASIALVLSGWFDNNLIGAAAYTSSGSRYTAFGTSLKAAGDYFPFGSGIGSFNSVYRMYEAPELITNTYMNHAHSDYIEIFLETGAVGAVCVLLFLLWWLRQTIGIWRSAEPNVFARAATIASAAIMTHSIVDYPLRTAAISAIFAVCCALMAAPGFRRRSAEQSVIRPARHLTAE